MYKCLVFFDSPNSLQFQQAGVWVAQGGFEVAVKVVVA
jgi:hypothetical protein